MSCNKKRVAIKLRARKIIERDGGICQYCQRAVDLQAEPNTDLHKTYDHVIPKAKGWLSTMGNLVTACYSCNQRKGDLLPLDFFWGRE